MKRILIVVALVAGVLSFAGAPMEAGIKADNDTLVIPRILAITDAGLIVTNVDIAVGPRNPNAFNLPATPNLFIQCPDAGAWIYTDVTSTGPGRGVMVQAGGAYSTACFAAQSIRQFDGGMYNGCVVAMAPLAGAAGANSAQCIVHITRER